MYCYRCYGKVFRTGNLLLSCLNFQLSSRFQIKGKLVQIVKRQISESFSNHKIINLENLYHFCNHEKNIFFPGRYALRTFFDRPYPLSGYKLTAG